MAIRCLATDDEPLALKQIVSYINKTPFLQLIGQCDSAIQTIEVLKNNTIDLMFIDINMPELNGLDLVKTLEKPPIIVFVTAHSEYAMEGFRVNAIDYLLKPIGYVDFLKSANKVKSWFDAFSHPGSEEVKTNREFLFVKSDYKLLRISFNDINYIEGMSEYIKIHRVDSNSVMTLLSMKYIEDVLPKENFLRVHRSYIVNLSKISVIERNRIILNEKVVIPVGNQYKSKFQNYIDKNFLA
jgi:two-component system LytT family response regulator